MASPREDAPVSSQPSPQEASARPPRRAETTGEAADADADRGVRCSVLCFHLPSHNRGAKKKKKKQPTPVVQLGATAGAGKIAAVRPLETTTTDEASSSSAAAAAHRVTFLASASLSTWWPASPRRVSGRASSSSSFSHWRRSLSSSRRRVMPHCAAAAVASAPTSFSFPSSPVSASTSCTSTPKLVHGCHVD
uniref:Uncharacterized protein n=1 Tax=Leersia perrieri TaxID=77586 RepID=A0A0D9WI69_9ORYZ